jgi:methylated-DNA-[protein]-cysteine S-methyltransferase
MTENRRARPALDPEGRRARRGFDPEDRLAPPTFDPADAAAAAARFAATAAADVHYALVDSPVGTLVAAATPRGLATLSYEDQFGGADGVLDWLADRLSPRMLEAPARLDDVRRELDEYFAGRRRDFDLPIDWALASAFGRRVLKATAKIPFGQVSTYGAVASKAGNPKASRAAGRALGANPIPIVVPCHRVIGASGRLVGYTGGLERKVALLEIEGIVLPG